MFFFLNKRGGGGGGVADMSPKIHLNHLNSYRKILIVKKA